VLKNKKIKIPKITSMIICKKRINKSIEVKAPFSKMRIRISFPEKIKELKANITETTEIGTSLPLLFEKNFDKNTTKRRIKTVLPLKLL